MRYDTKIAIIVRSDLADWQKLNVTAFLAGGLVGQKPELAGENYLDGSGVFYGPLIRQPILIYGADGTALQKARNRAQSRGITPCIYTDDLFRTGGDVVNRAAVAEVPTDDLDLVGLAVHGDAKQIDKILKGFRLHG